MSCILQCVDISFLKEKCLNIEKSLKHDNSLDIDGFDLISELNILRKITGLENNKPIDILNYIRFIKYSEYLFFFLSVLPSLFLNLSVFLLSHSF